MCATLVCGRVRSPQENAHDFWNKSVQSPWRYLPTSRDIYEPIITYHLDTAGGIVKHGSAVATWNGHALDEWKQRGRKQPARWCSPGPETGRETCVS
jgi:hypothetical protein